MAYHVFSTFGALPVGTPFRLNKQIKSAGDATPITWLKVSTRTARVNGNGAVFYFGQRETVWIDPSVSDALDAREAKGMANAECSNCGDRYPAKRAALGYQTCLACGDHAARQARAGWCIAPAGHKQGYTIHTSTGARDALRGLNKTTT